MLLFTLTCKSILVEIILLTGGYINFDLVWFRDYSGELINHPYILLHVAKVAPFPNCMKTTKKIQQRLSRSECEATYGAIIKKKKIFAPQWQGKKSCHHNTNIHSDIYSQLSLLFIIGCALRQITRYTKVHGL